MKEFFPHGPAIRLLRHKTFSYSSPRVFSRPIRGAKQGLQLYLTSEETKAQKGNALPKAFQEPDHLADRQGVELRQAEGTFFRGVPTTTFPEASGAPRPTYIASTPTQACPSPALSGPQHGVHRPRWGGQGKQRGFLTSQLLTQEGIPGQALAHSSLAQGWQLPKCPWVPLPLQRPGLHAPQAPHPPPLNMEGGTMLELH